MCPMASILWKVDLTADALLLCKFTVFFVHEYISPCSSTSCRATYQAYKLSHTEGMVDEFPHPPEDGKKKKNEMGDAPSEC